MSQYSIPLALPFLQDLLKCRGMREDFAVQDYLLLNFIVTRSITLCYLGHHGNSFVTVAITLQCISQKWFLIVYREGKETVISEERSKVRFVSSQHLTQNL